jgi:dienelactone hydrolase
MKLYFLLFQLLLFALNGQVWAQAKRVVDIPTRPGVTQRFLLLQPEKPKAAVILFPGGQGGQRGIKITLSGNFKGEGPMGNFLQRARQMFVSKDLMVALVDAPSDRQNPPYLGAGFRTKPEHAADIKAVIAWLKQQANIPVWVIGNCAGTFSAASITVRLAPSKGGPDGLVLTSTQLTNEPNVPSVSKMPGLDRIQVPTLVVHHKLDGCQRCKPAELPRLMDKLTASPRKELIVVEGGKSEGDPCESLSYHGFNGIEREVADRIAEWITQ